MSTKTPTLTVGLRAEIKRNAYDHQERLRVHVMLRRPGEAYPINGNSTPFGPWDHEAPRHLYGRSLGGLHVYGYVFDAGKPGARMVGFEQTMVDDIFSATRQQVAGIAKAMKLADAAILKEIESTHAMGGQMTMGRAAAALAKSVKAEWFATPEGPDRGFYSDVAWTFVPLAQGLRTVSNMAAEMVAKVTPKLEELRA